MFQAIEESGYRPNLVARQLATKNNHPDPGAGGHQHPLPRRLLQRAAPHAARMTEEQGGSSSWRDGKHSADEERQAIQYLLDSRCDGVIIYPRFLSVEEMDDIIEQHPQPIMVLNWRLPRHPAHCVYA